MILMNNIMCNPAFVEGYTLPDLFVPIHILTKIKFSFRLLAEKCILGVDSNNMLSIIRITSRKEKQNMIVQEIRK